MDDRAVTRRRRHWLYRALDKIEFPLDADGCWSWTANLNSRGYPMMRSEDGDPVLVSRLAWESEHGKIPPKHEVHHRCLNQLCVRPSHLQLLSGPEHRKLHAALKRAAA